MLRVNYIENKKHLNIYCGTFGFCLQGMFNFFASGGSVYSGNVATGCFDSGFIISAAVIGDSVAQHFDPSAVCRFEKGQPFSVNLTSVIATSNFYNNEAVACRRGLFVIPNAGGFSAACPVLSRFKSWRNAVFGIVVVDAQDLIVSNVVLAENAVGKKLFVVVFAHLIRSIIFQRKCVHFFHDVHLIGKK